MTQNFHPFKSRKKHEVDLYEIISKWTQKFSSTELMELLQQNEIPAGRLSNYHQILSDPHLNSREYFVDFSDINQRYDGKLSQPPIIKRKVDTYG